MSETLNKLTNLRVLRAAAREATLEQLEAAVEKLQIVIEEKRAELKAQEEENAKFLEGLSKYQEMLDKDGISAEELAALLSGKKADRKARKPRKPLAPKYKFVDANGNEKTWTGQGRTPRELVGKDLSQFAI